MNQPSKYVRNGTELSIPDKLITCYPDFSTKQTGWERNREEKTNRKIYPVLAKQLGNEIVQYFSVMYKKQKQPSTEGYSLRDRCKKGRGSGEGKYKGYFNKNKKWYFGAYHLGFRNSYNFNSEIICFGLRDTFFIKGFAKRWYNKDACVLIYIYFLSLFLRSVFSFCFFFRYLTLFDFKTPFVLFICRQNIEHVSRLGFSCSEKEKT